MSRKKGELEFSARIWDVKILKSKKWKLAVNTEIEIEDILSNYRKLSNTYFNSFEQFEPNTVVVWTGLYKFEDYIESKNRQEAIKKEITKFTVEHLSLFFHRFIDQNDSPF